MTGGCHAKSIPLDNWHQSSRVSLDVVMNDMACLNICRCTLSESSLPTIVVSDNSDDPLTPTSEEYWVVNLLYRLTKREWEMIRSPKRHHYFSCSEDYSSTVSYHVWPPTNHTCTSWPAFNTGVCILSTLVICMHLTLLL